MTRATEPVRILTVCLGNICRSPTAQAALLEAADMAGIAVSVRSAGTGTWHLGQPPDPRMRAAAEASGLVLDGVAEKCTAEMLRDADVVFAMDTSNLTDITSIARHAGIDTPLYLFRDFDPQAGSSPDVPDPYYGGPDGFDEVVAIARRTAHHIMTQLDTILDPSNIEVR